MTWFKFKCGNFEKQYYVTTILPTHGGPLVMFCMGALIKFCDLKRAFDFSLFYYI